MFVDEGHWDKIYNALQPGDIVLISSAIITMPDQSIAEGEAELLGTGSESKFQNESNGQYKVVYTYGWYLRKFIMDAKERGVFRL